MLHFVFFVILVSYQTYPLRRALHLHLVHPLPLHHPVDAQHATHLLITVVPPIHPPHGAEDGPERRGVETKPCKRKMFGSHGKT